MVYEPKRFEASGPKHLLTCCDWENTSYRRSVAASLVQGVYSIERERICLEKEGIQHNHASQWWERFQFELIDFLSREDEKADSLYFGAIYKLRSANQPNPNAPKYVIAFRGTIPSSSEDIRLDLKHVFNTLESSPRCQTAFEAVRSTVEMAGGAANVWLAGHSLGASIAMLAGRKMVRDHGIHLETFLFNPPFISAPIGMIKNKTLRLGGRIAGSLLKAGISQFRYRNDHPQKDMFDVLSEWTPYLYVNPSDRVSKKYIGYFEHREKMEKIGLGKIENIATRRSFRCLIRRDWEPWHIIPNAHMTVNLSPSDQLLKAHEIDQWWQPSLRYKEKPYMFKTH